MNQIPIRLGFLAGCVLIASCVEGTTAQPMLNSNPALAVRLLPHIERAPKGADLRALKHYMVARYESHQLECSRIRHLAGGSVVNPVHEVTLDGNPLQGFVVWVDLIKQDRCKWKLTQVRYGLLADGEVVLETAFPFEKLNASPLIYHCKWGRKIARIREGARTTERMDEGCGMLRRRGKTGLPVDDAKIIIEVKQD